ncbi:MAG: type II toxin-antitoxin system HicB family antitoxin, partial [Clostridiales bacterium]|nr:type II toxin-antitoxin system HicB family antitoxin [Clostridiales bacterium]
SDEDGCYVTEVPELPGCMADGKTPQEALQNTQDVIKIWLDCAKADGERIPEPVCNHAIAV